MSSTNPPPPSTPTTTSKHFSSHTTNTKLTSSQPYLQHQPTSLSLDISLFSSSSSSLKRINQIKPTPKLNIINHNHNHDKKCSNVKYRDLIVFKQQEGEQEQEEPLTLSKQSINYQEISISKPLFSWKNYLPICGFQSKTGSDGCLCTNPCPFSINSISNYQNTHFKLYQQLLSQPIQSSQSAQILKDIHRTHPQCLTFSNNPRFQQMLKQVLSQYTIYDPQVGYVQGMNLIVGTLLYHIKNAELTFWAFVDLMDEQQLRMIYLPGFQHLHSHQSKIIDLLDTKVNDLMLKMDQLNIIPQSFLNGWILSLMGICIPLEYMHLLIEKFRTHGWNFIYQLIITYLLFLKQSLLRAEDQSEFLMSLTTKNSMEYGRIWEELIQNAQNFPLDINSQANLNSKN